MVQEDRERVKVLLVEAIRALCKNGLKYDLEFCIEGLLGVTLDRKDVFLINIKETIRSEDMVSPPHSPLIPHELPKYSSSHNYYSSHGPSLTNDCFRHKADQDDMNHQADIRRLHCNGHVDERKHEQVAFADALVRIIDTAKADKSTSPARDALESPPMPRLDPACHRESEAVPMEEGTRHGYPNTDDSYSTDDMVDDEEEELRRIRTRQVHLENYRNRYESPSPQDIEQVPSEGYHSGRNDDDPNVPENLTTGPRHCNDRYGEQTDGIEAKVESEDTLKQSPPLPQMNEFWLHQMMKMRQFSYYPPPPLPTLPSPCGPLEQQFRLHVAQQAAANLGVLMNQHNEQYNNNNNDGHNESPNLDLSKPKMKQDSPMTKRSEGKVHDNGITEKMVIFKCTQCGKIYSSDRAYKDHARKHKGEYYLHCPVCGKGFLCRRDLKGHMSNKHASEKEFKCQLCRKEFGYHQSYRNHMKFVHKLG